jgi:hypothetical protein
MKNDHLEAVFNHLFNTNRLDLVNNLVINIMSRWQRFRYVMFASSQMYNRGDSVGKPKGTDLSWFVAEYSAEIVWSFWSFVRWLWFIFHAWRASRTTSGTAWFVAEITSSSANPKKTQMNLLKFGLPMIGVSLSSTFSTSLME